MRHIPYVSANYDHGESTYQLAMRSARYFAMQYMAWAKTLTNARDSWYGSLEDLCKWRGVWLNIMYHLNDQLGNLESLEEGRSLRR